MQRGAWLLLMVVSLQASNRPASGPSVSLCEVFANPSAYERKGLTITAGYRVGFEWSELSCFTCSSRDKVWVEFDPDVKGASKIGKAKRFDQLYKVTFVGTFEGGPGGGYAVQFRVIEVKTAKLRWRFGRRTTQIPEQVKAQACGR